ncbi:MULTISPECIES: hypothetical protein [Streptomyces]|uniref:hypothetical protein n=1 Tax=Streptomyces TaxID=1883 RepID=UPI0035DC9F11
MKILPSRRTTSDELLAMAKRDLANAKTEEDREKFRELVRMIEHGIYPPWIKPSRKRG